MTWLKRVIVALLQRLERVQLSVASRYLGAVLVVALCCAARAQMSPAALPYLFFIPGLMLIGFWFGTGPSVLGCTLAVLAAQYFFIGPLGFAADWTAWANSLSFGLVTLGMATICSLLRSNLNAVDHLNRTLEDEVERRTDERDSIWNVSPDLICTLSDSGQLLAMNPTWQLATGWSEEQLKAGAFYSFISPAQLADALRELNGKPIAELDTQSVRSNGQPLLLNWRITSLAGMYCAVARDVTQYRERQQAFERVSSQLQQSQKMESLGQLTGGLAHDFNNLLTVISGSHDMIEQRLAQGRHGELDRYLALARTATRKASTLTHRLLAFARRQPLASATVDAVLLIEDMKDLLSRTLTPRIEFQFEPSQGSALCYCDAHQLENALLNLCINARDAMPQGGRLQVRVSKVAIGAGHAELAAGEYVEICVTDTGMGMPASVAERAFEPFFTTKPLGSGTGLGLSMVKDFARQASGTALIDSVMGEGTSVSLLLPIYRDPAPAAVAAPVDESAGEPASQRGCAMVIEDEAAIRELVAESLKELGFEVIEVTAPAEALQQIDQRPDLQLVVTDLVLPGSLAGDHIAEGARARVPGLRVLFISGLIDGAAELAERQDRTRLLPKPFTLQQFKACVEGMFTEANTTTQP
ncbi:ATP-binding protein [Pseudomonas sp. S32]|uniref:ATP-binding protein n=1 Tax=Pseudomonas sp. S32 TaxID=2767448 RepID=UPI0019135201|nr:ATP-binding protein [Pseudomonas sp. S32]MBK5005535.1 response regulator [Pseudomonas sp. S32]